MPERDWEKDWKLCEQRYSRPEDWLVATIYNSEGKIISSKVYLPNARLVMEAREALSYWLQRVRELEAQVAVMKEALEFYAYTKPVCACIIDGVYTENYKDHGEIARQALAISEKEEEERP